ncbi:hypothetical protein HNR46_001462 [Haloferula luteola]|uniref:DUF3108 domain-containing protein n=1 Tax=Haloferula luteola TaxID=595692 RepID=A0A840V940_9BACT|nr:hypothetical protein [Haloferula luteola]MBB5351228.1 hypothetical protein [Haloferula luteola]
MTRPILCALFALLLGTHAIAQGLPGIDIKGPFARVKRNEDGSETRFERGKDERTLIKSTYSAGAHNLTLKTVYRLDDKGNPLKCDIYDGLGNKLYKTSFGYSKRPGPTLGKLVQELLYDVRVKRFFPGSKNEMPVHMFIYKYKPDGTAELPVGMTLIKGKTAEEVFGKGVVPEVQALPNLNELEEVSPANPNAKPLRR